MNDKYDFVIDGVKYVSPLSSLEDDWDLLTKDEQTLMRSYARHIEKGTDLKLVPALMKEVNKIHENRGEIHIGCMPCVIAMTNDLSGYEPKDIA